MPGKLPLPVASPRLADAAHITTRCLSLPCLCPYNYPLLLPCCTSETAESVVQEYAELAHHRLSHEENVRWVLRPLLHNCARRLLFSYGRTCDESVYQVLDQILTEYLTNIGGVFGHLKSHTVLAKALEPLMDTLPQRLLNDEWLGELTCAAALLPSCLCCCCCCCCCCCMW